MTASHWRQIASVAGLLLGWQVLVQAGKINERSINPVLPKAAQDLGASRLQIFAKVILPGALPNIFTGLRRGAGMALILVLITEIEATPFS